MSKRANAVGSRGEEQLGSSRGQQERAGGSGSLQEGSAKVGIYDIPTIIWSGAHPTKAKAPPSLSSSLPNVKVRQFAPLDFNFTFDGGLQQLVSEDVPAPMKAISNPMFWDNFMMPGWSWPSGDDPMTGGQQQQLPPPGMPQQSAFPQFAAQVPVPSM